MSPRTAVLSFLLTTTLAAQQATPPPAPTGGATDAAAAEAAFDAGLAAVHAAMQKAKWADARAALLALLQAHTGAVHAQAQAEAIASDLRTCAFYATAKTPKLAELITGKINAWDERSGRIKVTYADHFADWKGEGDLLANPLVFAGSYTVTMSGKAYPGGDKSVRLWFDMDPAGDGWFMADFGAQGTGHTWIPPQILQGKGDDEPRSLAKARSMVAKPGAPFKAVVKVGDGKVEMVLDNKTVHKVEREKVEFGQVGIARGCCDEIVLEGRIEPSCLQSRVDDALAEQREAFDKKFDPKKELPAWLFERPQLERADPRSESWLPGGERGVSKPFHEMLDLIAAGKHAEASTRLAKLSDRDAPPVARSFVDAVLQLRHGHPERAEAICAKLLADDAEQSQTRVLRAQALDQLGRSAEALAELAAVRAADPGFLPAWEASCVQLLQAGRPEEARRVVREAKVRHGLWDDVAQLERMLAMAARGPAWPRRFSHRSTHYEVVSDIDAKVCFDACQVLEQSYVNLMAQLTWIKEDKDQPRFRVFLFSGEAGYQEFVKGIVGEAVPHTAGLYTSALKQLLIWNVPRRDDMVRTIRHEGFHQFLDRLMPNPPTWLNEGMAEFWETAQREQGRMQGGQVRKDHLATLARSRAALPKLEVFVHGGHGDFYANAQQRYAQAWALVHFLRKGPPEYGARFTKLWAELRSAKSTRAAVDAAFAGVDWAKMQQDLDAHLASLK